MAEFEIGRYGLRTFGISMFSGYIRSIAVPGNHWAGGVCKAQCLQPWVNRSRAPRNPPDPRHKAPKEGCHCGIYGALDYRTLVSQYKQQTDNVLAVISAEGQTLIGPYGFRTEFARVVAYWSNSRTAARLCREQFPGATCYTNEFVMMQTYGIPKKPSGLIDPDGPSGSILWKTGEERRVYPLSRNGEE